MYSSINKYCNLPGTALTSNRKYLVNDISAVYEYPRNPSLFNQFSQFNESESKPQQCSMDKNGTCTEWKKNPELWGPHLWAYLHYAAANYPEKPTVDNIKEMTEWLCSLPVTIPCENCSKHYRSYIEENKSRLTAICADKNSLFNFLVDIHNKVNAQNGKVEMSYSDAKALYV